MHDLSFSVLDAQPCRHAPAEQARFAGTDVRAVLAYGLRGCSECWIVPIEVCYDAAAREREQWSVPCTI